MDRREFIKMMLGAGLAAVIPIDAIASMAERPFASDWGDTSGAAQYGRVYYFSDDAPVLLAEGESPAMRALSCDLRLCVKEMEAEGKRVRGWRWYSNGKPATDDPYNLPAVGWKAWVD